MYFSEEPSFKLRFEIKRSDVTKQDNVLGVAFVIEKIERPRDNVEACS